MRTTRCLYSINRLIKAKEHGGVKFYPVWNGKQAATCVMLYKWYVLFLLTYIIEREIPHQQKLPIPVLHVGLYAKKYIIWDAIQVYRMTFIMSAGVLNRSNMYNKSPADSLSQHNNVMKWNRFPRYWPFLWGKHVAVTSYSAFDDFLGVILNKLLHKESSLTHWGRVTHIHVSKLTIIGSDNGLSPGRHQAIIWTNAGILLIRTIETNFNEILISIPTFSFKKMHL